MGEKQIVTIPSCRRIQGVPRKKEVWCSIWMYFCWCDTVLSSATFHWSFVKHTYTHTSQENRVLGKVRSAMSLDLLWAELVNDPLMELMQLLQDFGNRGIVAPTSRCEKRAGGDWIFTAHWKEDGSKSMFDSTLPTF